MSDSFLKRIFRFKKISYTKVGSFQNNCMKDMVIILEPQSFEITLSSDQEFDLLIEEGEEALPLDIIYHEENGLQVSPTAEFPPNWKIRFQGKVLEVDYIMKLSEYIEA